MFVTVTTNVQKFSLCISVVVQNWRHKWRLAEIKDIKRSSKCPFELARRHSHTRGAVRHEACLTAGCDSHRGSLDEGPDWSRIKPAGTDEHCHLYLLFHLPFEQRHWADIKTSCKKVYIYIHTYIYVYIWYHVMWCDIWYDMIWYDMIWYDMIWYDIFSCNWVATRWQ